jgi:uncharacterized membrane protein
MLDNLILKIFGVSGEGVQNIDKIGIYFLSKIPYWIVFLVSFILTILIFYIYFKEIKTVSVKLKIFLGVLRVFTLIFLLIIIMEPVFIIERVSFLQPYVVVLVDNSLSMGIKDFGKRRIDIVNSILNDNMLLLIKRLESKYRLKFYNFSTGDAVSLKYDSKKQQDVNFTVDKNGFSTSIGTALRKVIDDLTGQPIAGIILFTDGCNNSGEDPLDVVQTLSEKKIPVYVIGIGDPKIKKDLLITNVFADDVANKGDIVNMSVTLDTRGYKDIKIPVRLLKKDKLIKEEVVSITDLNEKKEINLNFLADEAGEFEYVISVPTLSDEVSDANNKKIVKMKITDDKIKVLYVDGYPRWQYRFLIRSLKRDKNVILSGLLETSDPNLFSEGNKPIKSYPVSKEELFEYDVIIIGDVSSYYFSKKQLEITKKFVEEKGGGLLFLPGENWAIPTNRIKEIEEILPVNLQSGLFLKEEPFKPELTNEGKQSPILSLEDDFKESVNTWNMLEGFYWTLCTSKEKPGATVYAKFPLSIKAGANIFIASHRYGNGKVLFISSDELWRWRFRKENKYFYRFFGQVIRWLGPERLTSESKFVKLTTDKRKYTAGERVLINAKILDKNYNSIKDDSVTAYYKTSEGSKESVTLFRISKETSLFSGEFIPIKGGEYDLWIQDVKVNFSVEVPNLEYESPELNEGLLKKLAEKTDGEYFTPSTVSNLAKKVIAAKPKVIIRTEKDLKDSPFVIIVLIVLLSIEWFLRRNKNMM